MEIAIVVIQGIATVISSVAAIAAWRAVGAATRSTKIQEDALAASIVNFKAQQQPRLAAVFRTPTSDYIYLDVSNHGGLAVDVILSEPELITDYPIKDVLNRLDMNVVFDHGLNTLRPGETLSFLVGNLAWQRIANASALDELAKSPGNQRPLLRYRIEARFTDVFGEQGQVILTPAIDATARDRHPLG